MDDTYNECNYDTSSVAILAQSTLQARQQSEAPLPSQQCPVPILMAFASMLGKWKDMICSSAAQPSWWTLSFLSHSGMTCACGISSNWTGPNSYSKKA